MPSSTIPQRGGPGALKSVLKSNRQAIGGKSVLSGMSMGGKGAAKRHRRLARRGGVKRISANIYDEARGVMKDHLTLIIRDCVTYVEHRNAKTVTVNDVIFALRRIGRPIYGFDPDTFVAARKKQTDGAGQALDD
ncbi:hypothetical protein B0H66DRAFT_602859 [Apodospora peruviana]|uniref:Histone H4 n=1 Tax=Apodospora peruviana TaxID=516989 RepID=A0AAE0I4I6_9PEZI|nr:hypothetical protein B0H66DRAFT_602859 [Apodospora peruviana]